MNGQNTKVLAIKNYYRRKVHNYFNFKLKLEINPDPKTEIIVSRARVQAFKAWMNGEVVN